MLDPKGNNLSMVLANISQSPNDFLPQVLKIEPNISQENLVGENLLYFAVMNPLANEETFQICVAHGATLSADIDKTTEVIERLVRDGKQG